MRDYRLQNDLVNYSGEISVIKVEYHCKTSNNLVKDICVYILETIMNCMNCQKQYELNSLRAAKKRFESGKEVSQLKAELEKEKRKTAALTDQVNKYKWKSEELRTECDFYKNSYEIEKDHHETLVEKYTSLQNTVSNRELMNDEALWNTIDKLVLDLMADNEDKAGQITKLTAQINRDFHTSSSPSSQFPNRAPIQNSREKTGRKQGGQPGHLDHSGIFHPAASPGRTGVVNTYDPGVGGHMISFIVSTITAILAAFVLRHSRS